LLISVVIFILYKTDYQAFNKNIEVNSVEDENKEKNIKDYKADFIKTNKIILITLDNLRKDHLSHNGYPINTSPFIDYLTGKSIVFKNAFSHCSITPVADASIFTSLYPLQHQLFNFNKEKPEDSFLMMAEFLKEKGYKTAAFTSVKHAGIGNIFQGFEKINIPDKETRAADQTFNLALNWVQRLNKSDKYFLWVHIADPHYLFDGSKKYFDYTKLINNAIDKATLEEALFKNQNIKTLCNDTFKNQELSVRSRKYILNKIIDYDARIKFVDDEFKKFYNNLELSNDSLWVITSEHGEGLCSHAYAYHGLRIYNEQLHVPLLLHFPFRDFSKEIEDIVEHVDILPTIAELVGFDLNKQIKPIQGTSLLTFLDDNPNFPDKYAFSQRRYFSEESILTDKDRMFSLQNKNFKYIFNENNEDEFFSLKEDPLELNNIINDNLEVEEGFKKEILERIVRFTDNKDNDSNRIEDEELKKILENLGYFK
jgi:arylsulfatase A-like enzyme